MVYAIGFEFPCSAVNRHNWDCKIEIHVFFSALVAEISCFLYLVLGWLPWQCK